MAAEFHPLIVAAVEPLTDTAVSISFEVPEALRSTYLHTPGQHVIVKAEVDGDTVRRSYSICSPVGESRIMIGVKKLPGGVFSTFANENLQPGDVLEVTPPTGDFVLEPDRANENHYIAVVAGSGITPVLSMISSALMIEPSSRFTLIYGNRDGASIMFLDHLDALKNRYPDRFAIFHVLSREVHAIPLFQGRLDEDKLRRLFTTVVDARTATAWYLCGPPGVVDAARSVLTAGRVSDACIHDELFFAGDGAGTVVAEDDAAGAVVKFTLAGRTSTVIVDPAGVPILDHALAVRPETPFSCRSGACASCRAVVIEGEVTMDRNWALNQAEVDAGQILTCQAHPVSETVELSYDV